MTRLSALDAIRNARPAVAPSMLKCDFANLHRDVALLETANAPLLHLDVMDGHFVPNLSYGPMVIERLRETTELPLDAHLMISEPARYLDEYIRVGCDLITVHIEAEPNPAELLDRIRSADVAAGLALNPGTPVDRIEAFLPQVDLVLVMSVEPGFGGQSFIPSALEKLRELRKRMQPEQLLSVDGGVGTSTIADCAAAGADVFVAGSAIFNHEDYGAAVSELIELASNATSDVSGGRK